MLCSKGCFSSLRTGARSPGRRASPLGHRRKHPGRAVVIVLARRRCYLSSYPAAHSVISSRGTWPARSPEPIASTAFAGAGRAQVAFQCSLFLHLQRALVPNTSHQLCGEEVGWESKQPIPWALGSILHTCQRLDAQRQSLSRRDWPPAVRGVTA